MYDDLTRPLPGSHPRPQRAAAELPRARRRRRTRRRLQPALRRPADAVPDASTATSSTTSAFQGSGCAISKASASMMTDAVKGKTVAEARRAVRALSPDGHDAARIATVEDLGKLSVLAGVREFPVRVKCASLAWHTLKAALERKRDRRRRNEDDTSRAAGSADDCRTTAAPEACHGDRRRRRSSPDRGEDRGAEAGDRRGASRRCTIRRSRSTSGSSG